MPRNAGFFPCSEDMLARYYERMLEDMREIDFLGAWRPEEIFFKRELRNAVKLNCFYTTGLRPREKSWTRMLSGKRVLVIHPFAQTIKRQYAVNRENVHSADTALPLFASLEVIKAVQSIAGNTDGFSDWFEALRYMEEQIAQRNFDIALIGCGAYGFCLAAYVKRLGRQALHVGGDLQLYFGIKGKRWEGRGLFNEHWVSPAESEKPSNLKSVEGGCYW